MALTAVILAGLLVLVFVANQGSTPKKGAQARMIKFPTVDFLLDYPHKTRTRSR